MITIFAILFFTLGLIIGSFLNVVICRLNTSKSLGGRSACMSCRSRLKWYELIPVFSFCVLRGRCRTCRTKISSTYPLVELSSGFVFLFVFLKLQNLVLFSLPVFSITYAYYVSMFSILLVIAVYDLRHKIIPDMLSLAFGVLAFAGLFFFESGSYPELYLHIPPVMDFLSGLIISMPFAFLWLISSGAWMGLGDAKLALGLGWFLGMPLSLSAVVLSFWTGAVIGLLLVLFSVTKKRRGSYGMKTELPFAPYLAFGAFVAFIFDVSLFIL